MHVNNVYALRLEIIYAHSNSKKFYRQQKTHTIIAAMHSKIKFHITKFLSLRKQALYLLSPEYCTFNLAGFQVHLSYVQQMLSSFVIIALQYPQQHHAVVSLLYIFSSVFIEVLSLFSLGSDSVSDSERQFELCWWLEHAWLN